MQKKIKVCEHSLCTLYDLYCLRELARAQSKQEKQTWRLYSDHFILFSEEFVSVFFFSVLTSTQFVMCENICFSMY